MVLVSKWSRPFFFFVLTVVGFIFLPTLTVQAQEACESNVTVTTRDSANAMVKNIKWELWCQGRDADGNPITCTKITSSNTGIAAQSTIKINPNT